MNQTAIKQIKAWLGIRTLSGRDLRCPFDIILKNKDGQDSEVAHRNKSNSGDLCGEVFPDMPSDLSCYRNDRKCPCEQIGARMVSRRARLYVKAH